MSVRPQDIERMLENIRKASDWENKLVSANNLFHQGPSQYSAAVNQYGKIIEILLRHLFQEISVILPPKERTSFLQFEGHIGKGKPFGNFGLGQMIDFFSNVGMFALLNNFLKDDLFVPTRLNDINNFRIDQTHYDEIIEKTKVDDIRKDTTRILLRLRLIMKDPEIVETAKVEALDGKKTQKERIEGLQRILTKIRCGLLENAMVEFWSPLDREDGWSAVVEVKAEITGAYVDKDEHFIVIVRVLELQTPLDGEEEAYQDLSSKVREIIGSIASETKGKLEIVYFAEYEEPGLKGSAHACSDQNQVLYFQ